MENVSIVIPIYNESKYIENLIHSLHMQDYDHEKMDVIFVDGYSEDATVEIIRQTMLSTNIEYRLLFNTEKNVSKSMNIGIKESKGDIIVRLDGHTEIPYNYISLNVKYLKETGAMNVGCLIDTRSEGILGNAIAGVLSSPFGVGNSSFRIGSPSGYVDTVPFGCLWKKTFDELGYFNESLTRSEDNELNSRILKHGGKIYLFNDIQTIYHPRDTIKSLVKMGNANGNEIIQTILRYHENMRIRYLIPLFFVLYLIVGMIACFFIKIVRIPFIMVLSLYLILDFLSSFIFVKDKKHLIACGCLKLFIFPIFHVSYGIGSIRGILNYIKKDN